MKKQSRTDDVKVHELPAKKRGRPLLLGEELDKQVLAYLTNLRERGGVVNTAIAMACAKDIVESADANMLGCNGGHIHNIITKDWEKISYVEWEWLSAGLVQRLKCQLMFLKS